MTASRKLPGAVQTTVLKLLTQAAEAGEPCPTNAALGDIARAEANAMSSCIAGLERMGLITVERVQMRRIVTIVATGKSTCAEAKPRNWRVRETSRRSEPHRRKAAPETAPVAARASSFTPHRLVAEVFAESAQTMDRRGRAWTSGHRDPLEVAGQSVWGEPRQSAPVEVIDREPCFRCGVRGDVGCAHRGGGR